MACKVRDLVKESGGPSGGEGGSAVGGSGGRQSASARKGDDTEKEPEIGEDVQVVHKGDKNCIRCSKELYIGM